MKLYLVTMPDGSRFLHAERKDRSREKVLLRVMCAVCPNVEPDEAAQHSQFVQIEDISTSLLADGRTLPIQVQTCVEARLGFGAKETTRWGATAEWSLQG